jgi:hypothetical protein
MITAVDGCMRTVEGIPSHWRPQPSQCGSYVTAASTE